MPLITKQTETDVQLLTLAVQVGALKYACAQALQLLQDPDAGADDATRVERLLSQILEGTQ